MWHWLVTHGLYNDIVNWMVNGLIGGSLLLLARHLIKKHFHKINDTLREEFNSLAEQLTKGDNRSNG